MQYCQEMCFLCLTNNKTYLISYNVKQNPNDENNECLKILFYVYPELNKIKLDFPIYICRKCDGKLTSYYHFKVNGKINYERYLKSLYGENKEIVLKCTNSNVDNLVIKEEPIFEDSDDLIQMYNVEDEILKTNILETKTKDLQQISPDKIEYFEVNEIKTELLITHEIYEIQNMNDNINNQTKAAEITQNEDEFIPNDSSQLDLHEMATVIFENNQNNLYNAAPKMTTNTKDISTNPNQRQRRQYSNLSIKKLVGSSKCLETSKNESVSNSTMFKCVICLKIFNTKTSLKKHLNIHNKNKLYICAVCSKKFNRRQNFILHTRIHTGEKPYNCSNCSKKFSQKAHLRRHSRIHTGEKPYTCPECGMKFTQESSLVRHTSRMHNGNKPYSTNKSNLKIHYREKPYSCSNCSSKFYNKIDLKIHYRIHTGEKPYSCSICSRKFSRKSNLTAHSRLHTGNKPYCCTICSKTFSVKSSVKRHFHRYHKSD